jgi:hypothetical protein
MLPTVFIQGKMARVEGIVSDDLACNKGCSMVYAKGGGDDCCRFRIDAWENQ